MSDNSPKGLQIFSEDPGACIVSSLGRMFNPHWHQKKFRLQMMPYGFHLQKTKINGMLSPAACLPEQNSPCNPGKQQGPAPCRESSLRSCALSLLQGKLSSLGTPAQERNVLIYLGELLLLWLLDGLCVLVVSGQAWMKIIYRDPAAKPMSSLYSLTWDHNFYGRAGCLGFSIPLSICFIFIINLFTSLKGEILLSWPMTVQLVEMGVTIQRRERHRDPGPFSAGH